MPEAAFLKLLQRAGFTVEILEKMRNARTGHPATAVLAIRAVKSMAETVEES